MEMQDFTEDHADFGTFEPMLYQMEHDEDSEGEDGIHEIEGDMMEEDDLENEKLPEEGQRNIPQDFGSLGAPGGMQDSHPQIPQRFRAIQMSRAIRRMAERYSRGRGRGRNRRADENSIKFDNLFAQLQTQNIDELKTNIALLNTEICMSNESMKRAMRPERFVKPLLTHLENGLDSALMLSCSNCLLTIIDIFPEVSETIIAQKGLKILEEKGKNFEYIDVAEDCVKLLDKIADTCPGEVWSTGCGSHFLSFMDFFDMNVQKIIMDLTLKCIREFCSLRQWNDEVKQCVSLIINKCSRLGFGDGEMLIKNLECLSMFLKRLIDCREEEFHSDSQNSDGPILNSRLLIETFRLRNPHLFKSSGSKPGPKVLKIYDEIFDDQTCIVNFMDMLKGSPGKDNVDLTDQKVKQSQMIIFNILNNCTSCSTKICATVLKNGFLDIILHWMSPKNKIAGAFEDKVKNDSEFSENEDFKLGAGGTATTGYHMNKKNANAKIRDMIDSETKNNEKQILNLLSTLLSLDILKKQDLTPEEQDCKDVLLNRDIQSKLGIFGSNYLNNFVNLQSCSSTPIKPSNSLKEKQRLLEILNKIIILIHPQVLSETINPLIIARQLRSFLNSSNGYHPSKMSFHSNSLADRVVEQKYIYLCMKVIKNILKKTKNRDIDFCVPMIREGILKNIETVIGQGNNEEEKEKSSLPSIDYITSQISSRPSQAPSLMNAQRFGNRRNFDGMRDPFSDFSDSRVNPLAAKLKEFNDTKLKLKKKVLPFIKKELENANYKNEPFFELKRIARCLTNEQISSTLCKEALNRLSQLLIEQGMTYYEATESNIIESLHKFVIRRDEFMGKEKSLWNRIHIFIDEFAENQKGLTQLIQNLHNLINDDESIEDLHVSDNKRHPFLNYSRWNETLQVEIICEYESFQEPTKKPTPNLPSFLSAFDQSMSQYENQEGMKPPPKKEQELDSEGKMKQRDETFKKMRPFRVIIPSEYKMKAILRNIMANLKNVDSNRLNMRGRGLSGIIGRNQIRTLNNLSDDRMQNTSHLIIEDHVPDHPDEDNEGEDHRDEMMEGEFDDEDESDSELHRPGEETKQDFVVKLLPNQVENDGIDLNISVEDWIKRRIKACKPPKILDKVFSEKIFMPPNILKFTISENIPKDDKAESDEEIIGEFSDLAVVNAKIERGYSLYIKNDKYKKSLQDKELERVIQRDIQSNEKIQEQLGDSCKLLELMKFIFLLKSNNFKAILKSHYDSCKTKNLQSNFATKFNLKRGKFKSLFVNPKIDSLIRKYLVSKFNSDYTNSKDDALIEIVQHFPMMYEFKTRNIFFKLTAFGEIRNKYYASELFTRANSNNEGGLSLSRRRLDVPRDNILKDAYEKLEDLQSDPSFLEFRFDEEVGTGLGPTLEYYALIGKYIKENTKLWKKTSDNSLYPKPLDYKLLKNKQKRKIEQFFELVGTIIARSLMDERLIDLPISVVFWKLVFSETAILDDVNKIDKDFYKGLKFVQQYIDREDKIKANATVPRLVKEKYNKECEDLQCEGNQSQSEEDEQECSIENLCMSFVLPGEEEIELVENGVDVTVTSKNMREYIRSSLNCLFNDSVKLQVNAFRRGINSVFRIDALKCFLLEELEGLIGGEESHENGLEKWNKTLLEHVIPDHGYNEESPAFANFIQYMTHLNKEQLRNFLLFITGSPRLPLGGLKSLRPKLTVVKRTCEEGCNPDDFLPSVMTCQNYVKLPEYSSLEVLTERMNYAIKEGTNSFDLS